MCNHEEKYCPRCNAIFECKVGTIALCQCATVELNNKERNYIQQNYEDCLCASCMKEAKAGYYNNQFKNKIKKLLGFFER